MGLSENKQIVRRAFEALMGGDLSPLAELLSPDAVLHQCGFLQPIPASALLDGTFPGNRPLQSGQVELDRMIGEGDMVALHWRTMGRYSEPDRPERDGKYVNFPSMSFVRIENDKIAEIWNIQDVSTLQSQLWEQEGTSTP